MDGLERMSRLERDAVDDVGRGLGDEERILLRADADARELGRRGGDLLEEHAWVVNARWWNQRLWRWLARRSRRWRGGWGQWRGLFPWECQAAQSRQARPEEAQQPSWGAAKGGPL